MTDYFQRILGLILLFLMYLWNVNYFSFGSIVLSEENLQKAHNFRDTPLKVKSFPFYVETGEVALYWYIYPVSSCDYCR